MGNNYNRIVIVVKNIVIKNIVIVKNIITKRRYKMEKNYIYNLKECLRAEGFTHEQIKDKELLVVLCANVRELQIRVEQLEEDKRATARLMEDHLVRLGKYDDMIVD